MSKLETLYKLLPEIKCPEGCYDCCSQVYMLPSEAEALNIDKCETDCSSNLKCNMAQEIIKPKIKIIMKTKEYKECSKCKKVQLKTNFTYSKNTYDKLRPSCKSCNAEYTKNYTNPKSKKEINDYLKERTILWRKEWIAILKDHDFVKCSTCNYDKCFKAIEYHHLFPLTKKHNPSHLLRRKPTKKRIDYLFKNTVPLCSNCHRELHDSNELDLEPL